MSEITHLPKISYVNGNVRVNIDLNRFAQQLNRAQEWLGQQVLHDCKPLMPHLTGSLQQRSTVENGGKEVVFPGPYGRFQYMGKVMVDPDTGSPWARECAVKVVTDRNLSYSSPGATSHWFDTAKARHGAVWIAEVKRIGGGG